MNDVELKICCICSNPIEAEFTENGDAYWLDGHNALPVAEGRCCSKCNDNIVIPTRLINALMQIMREMGFGVDVAYGYAEKKILEEIEIGD